VRRLRGLLALAFLTLAAAAPAAQGDVVWLCRPGLADDPCTGSLATTVAEPDGTTRTVALGAAPRPRIDCFYVYPTVSEQLGANADKRREAAQIAIARYQAARFRQRCRVFAPMYRQATLAGLAVPALRTPDALRLAYGDVLEAWRAYLRDDNRGRGFVLIGHSQGSRMLRRLIREEIDPRRALRRRLVSAIIPGANVKVPVGKDVGGDFAHVRACRAPRQLHCVMAWSTFADPPPAKPRFGTSDETAPDPFGLPVGPRYEVLCTNPADLAGNGFAPLRTLLRTEPYPGIIGLLLTGMYGGPPPTAPTPWLVPQDRYRGRCEHRGPAHVLMLSPVGSARHLHAEPDATWGVHIADLNIALGDLVTTVHRQERAYLRARSHG
jgi:hypothetical protein